MFEDFLGYRERIFSLRNKKDNYSNSEGKNKNAYIWRGYFGDSFYKRADRKISMRVPNVGP